MSDIIQAIVMDGFHKGHVVRMSYHPVIELLRPRVVMLDTCCGGDEMYPNPHEIIRGQKKPRCILATTMVTFEQADSEND